MISVDEQNVKVKLVSYEIHQHNILPDKIFIYDSLLNLNRGILIKRGAVDSDRNTDNAWVEVFIPSYHDDEEQSFRALQFQVPIFLHNLGNFRPNMLVELQASRARSIGRDSRLNLGSLQWHAIFR